MKKILLFIVLISSSIYYFIKYPPINANIDKYISQKEFILSNELSTKLAVASKNITYLESICETLYYKARDNKRLKYCQEHNLAENIGGGCYHGLGSYTNIDRYNAFNYCNIKY